MEDALQLFFGFSNFRAGQQEIVSRVLQGQDVLAVLATGAGKSLCYQLPALMLPGVTFVVSPLIALMQDQVDNLSGRGIYSATFLNSSLSKLEQETRMQCVSEGLYKIVYLAPERMRMSEFRNWLKDLDVSLLVVDEAHCVSEWGHDFRTDYLLIHSIRELLPEVPALSLTATATPRVREDICLHVGLRNPFVYISTFDRPNLYFSAAFAPNRQSKYEAGVQFLHEQTGAGIVYVASRSESEELARYLQSTLSGRRVRCYHAGMSADERSCVQRQFIEGSVDLIVATNAFGMGIDKPDIRFVLHLHIPSSVEAYYQEAGRAGRDGSPSSCHIIYAQQDRGIHQYFVRKEFPGREQIERFLQLVSSLRNEDSLQKKPAMQSAGLNEEQLELLLHLLEKYAAIIRKEETAREIWLELQDKPLDEVAEDVAEELAILKSRRLSRYGEMIRVLKTDGCRRKAILAYFEEEIQLSADPKQRIYCCDWCRSQVDSAATPDNNPVRPPAKIPFLVHPSLPQTESEEAFQLGEQGRPEAIGRLLQLLESPSVSVRRMACSALGKIGQPQVVPNLLRSARDPNPQVRQYALKALGKFDTAKLRQLFNDEYRRKFRIQLQMLLQRETKEYNCREIRGLQEQWSTLLVTEDLG